MANNKAADDTNLEVNPQVTPARKWLRRFYKRLCRHVSRAQRVAGLAYLPGSVQMRVFLEKS